MVVAAVTKVLISFPSHITSLFCPRQGGFRYADAVRPGDESHSDS